MLLYHDTYLRKSSGVGSGDGGSGKLLAILLRVREGLPLRQRREFDVPARRGVYQRSCFASTQRAHGLRVPKVLKYARCAHERMRASATGKSHTLVERSLLEADAAVE